MLRIQEINGKTKMKKKIVDFDRELYEKYDLMEIWKNHRCENEKKRKNDKNTKTRGTHHDGIDAGYTWAHGHFRFMFRWDENFLQRTLCFDDDSDGGGGDGGRGALRNGDWVSVFICDIRMKK